MITEKDLQLEYLRDTGNYIITFKTVEVEYDHRTQDRDVDFTCMECGNEQQEDVWGQDESGTTDIDVDIIDENFHNWCIEKLLKYKNNDNKKDILPVK